MKPWHAAAGAWAYVMLAYAGSSLFGSKFFIAQIIAATAAATAAFLVAVHRDLRK